MPSKNWFIRKTSRLFIDEFVKSITDGARRKRPWGASCQVPYTPVKKKRDKKAQRFFRDEMIPVVCRVPEKLLQRSRWDFLRRHHLFSSFSETSPLEISKKTENITAMTARPTPISIPRIPRDLAWAGSTRRSMASLL